MPAKHFISKMTVALNCVAFTLIELLVVISIVALLVGILLPVLSSAREAGKRIACASNLKSLGAAVHLYSNDYDEKLPLFKLSSTVLGPKAWYREIYPYLVSYGNNKTGGQNSWYEALISARDSGRDWAYACPSAQYGSDKFSYAMNGMLLDRDLPINASEVALFSDWQTTNDQHFINPTNQQLNARLWGRHGGEEPENIVSLGSLENGRDSRDGTVNIAYSDAHVGGLEPSDVRSAGVTTGDPKFWIPIN